MSNSTIIKAGLSAFNPFGSKAFISSIWDKISGNTSKRYSDI